MVCGGGSDSLGGSVTSSAPPALLSGIEALSRALTGGVHCEDAVSDDVVDVPRTGEGGQCSPAEVTALLVRDKDSTAGDGGTVGSVDEEDDDMEDVNGSNGTGDTGDGVMDCANAVELDGEGEAEPEPAVAASTPHEQSPMSRSRTQSHTALQARDTQQTYPRH